jgi:toxin ParE1/3/4
MKPAIVSSDAEEDIAEASEFYRQTRGPHAAHALVHSLYEAFQRLAAHPLRGHLRPEIRDGLRSFLVHNYVILYEDREKHVFIARVIHQRRDLKKALEE